MDEKAYLDAAVVKKLEGVTRETNMLFDILVTSKKQNDAVLPENIFVQYFLPYLVGKLSFDDNPKALLDWLSITGGLTAGANIIDNAGNVLFHVPRLNNTDNIDVLSDSKPLRRINNEYDLVNTSPVYAEKATNEFEDNLREKFKDIIHTLSPCKEDQLEWEFIYKRYNIVSVTEQKIKSNQNITDNDGYEEINYD